MELENTCKIEVERAQFPSNSVQDSKLTVCILPPEVVTEILSRLPVKSLLKFRSVSKSWLALISSPQFINTHLSSSARKEDTHHILFLDVSEEKWNFKECPLRSLFYDTDSEAFDLDYSFGNASEDIRIVASCNGLILLADYSESSLLWNPTIRMHKKLPYFRPTWEKNRAIYGFGYDELYDDYKVLAIFFNYGGSDGVEVKIYSLKSDSWTSVDYFGEILNTSSGPYGKLKLTGSGLFANGKLHWDTIIVGPKRNNLRMGRDIICFDLANEKWEKMEKPSYGEGESEWFVGKLGTDLCAFSLYKGVHLGAWVMKEYGGVKESWINKFTISYSNGPCLDFPFFMSKNKGEILATFGSTSVIYNSEDNVFRYPHVINCYDCHNKEIYIESLVCPFSTEETENATKGRLKKLRSKQSKSSNKQYFLLKCFHILFVMSNIEQDAQGKDIFKLFFLWTNFGVLLVAN